MLKYRRSIKYLLNSYNQLAHNPWILDLRVKQSQGIQS